MESWVPLGYKARVEAICSAWSFETSLSNRRLLIALSGLLLLPQPVEKTMNIERNKLADDREAMEKYLIMFMNKSL